MVGQGDPAGAPNGAVAGGLTAHLNKVNGKHAIDAWTDNMAEAM